MTLDLRPRPRPVLGRLGLILGLAAFLLMLAHGWAGPFAAQAEAPAGIGEIWAEGVALARRLLAGEATGAPTAPHWTVDHALVVVAAGLAGLALLLGLAGVSRREPPVPALAGALLGAGAMALPLVGPLAA